MFKIDYASFGLGILVTAVIVGIAFWVADHRRHCCTACSRRTKKTCRIFTHQMDRDTPTGFRKVSVYVFRECVTCDQVRVDVIDKLMPTHVWARKPDKEKEFSSEHIMGLFKMTPHVRNPVGSSFTIRNHHVSRSALQPT